ncbi:hypothetical protein C5C42_15345 [Rathayibacter sp. AY1F7]|jgi:hypothetical protein|nr:hypothetical protein C5C54_13790 [Rathayibacter sp. AY1F2]PPH42452.1 hypothetical protein C5C42_15345 [Rathayibacter sp. AY1F7]
MGVSRRPESQKAVEGECHAQDMSEIVYMVREGWGSPARTVVGSRVDRERAELHAALAQEV